VDIIDSRWGIFAACMSAAVAISTAVLAWFTYRLAKQTLESVRITRSAMVAEEDRHRDGFLPHLALELVEEEECVESAEIMTFRIRLIRLYARNIGSGFAQDVHIESSSSTVPVEPTMPPPAVGVGDRIRLLSFSAEGIEMPADFSLVYRDAFGRPFASRIRGPLSVGSRYTWRRLDAAGR
jgi:hypothetical protein